MNYHLKCVLWRVSFLFSSVLFSLEIKSNNLMQEAWFKTYCVLVLDKRSEHQEGFALNTKIKKLNDYVNIEKLQAGDAIAGVDTHVENKVVLAESTYVTHAYEILTVQGLICAAASQMFYDEILHEWIHAKNITVQNHLGQQKVLACKKIRCFKKIYRLTTTDQTFILEHEILAHNNVLIAMAAEVLVIGAIRLQYPTAAAAIGRTISLVKSALLLHRIYESVQALNASILDAMQNYDVVIATRSYYEMRRAELLTLLEQYRNVKQAISIISRQSSVTNVLFSGIPAVQINSCLLPPIDVELDYSDAEKVSLLQCREQELLSIEKEIATIQIGLMLHLQDHAERLVEAMNEFRDINYQYAAHLKIPIPHNNRNAVVALTQQSCRILFMRVEVLLLIEQKVLLLEQLLQFYQHPGNVQILKNSTNLLDVCSQYQTTLNIAKDGVARYKQGVIDLQKSAYDTVVKSGLISQYTLNGIQQELQLSRNKKEQQADFNAKMRQSNSYHTPPPNDPDPNDDKYKKKKRVYTGVDYHHQNSRGGKLGGKSPGPGSIDGQRLLDTSIFVKRAGNQQYETRIGVDGQEFTVFREHAPGEFHGYTAIWDDLTDDMQKALCKSGIVKNIKTGRM